MLVRVLDDRHDLTGNRLVQEGEVVIGEDLSPLGGLPRLLLGLVPDIDVLLELEEVSFLLPIDLLEQLVGLVVASLASLVDDLPIEDECLLLGLYAEFGELAKESPTIGFFAFVVALPPR